MVSKASALRGMLPVCGLRGGDGTDGWDILMPFESDCLMEDQIKDSIGINSIYSIAYGAKVHHFHTYILLPDQ